MQAAQPIKGKTTSGLEPLHDTTGHLQAPAIPPALRKPYRVQRPSSSPTCRESDVFPAKRREVGSEEGVHRRRRQKAKADVSATWENAAQAKAQSRHFQSQALDLPTSQENDANISKNRRETVILSTCWINEGGAQRQCILLCPKVRYSSNSKPTGQWSLPKTSL